MRVTLARDIGSGKAAEAIGIQRTLSSETWPGRRNTRRRWINVGPWHLLIISGDGWTAELALVIVVDACLQQCGAFFFFFGIA